ncbi:MAG TPA: hypothetical protein VGS27_17750 [Candidatus Sulfotelmatobacter sp.]|nr:hypothetical protein [Candidatus Sulfotelmatobacter sp.]
MPSRPWKESPNNSAIIENVQAILRSKKLSLYAVSQRSAALYGRSSPHFVPHNLYYDLRSERFTPSVHQIFSLSRISGYRLRDWLRVLGLDLENITRLQIQLPARRTILLDTTLTDPNEWIAWFSNRSSQESAPSSITPLAQLLKRTAPRRISSISELKRRFLYAKVGREDALAFPDLVPGSIVRVDADRVLPLPQTKSSASDRIFLVEHSKGYFCCRIRFLSSDVVVPVADGLDYADVAFHHPQEARIRGVVDLELRPMLDAEQPRVPAELARRWKPQLLLEPQNLAELLKTSRLRLDISIREAANATRTVAELMNDDRYFISASSLSDYELDKTSPRDFHKIITLGSVYGLHFEAMMKAMSLDLDKTGPELMQEGYLFRAEPSAQGMEQSAGRTGFFEHLLNDCQGEIPFFLRDVLKYFSGSAPVSIDDFFWIGGNHDVLHPALADGLVVVLNRRRKAPIHFLSKPVWQQPIFIILKRDGRYLAASCSLENRTLVVHSYGPEFYPSAECRLHRDAEIVGQIVAIARQFT